MGGQAVHEDRVGIGHVHHFLIDTPIGKGLAALFVLVFVAHAGPHVGGDQVRAFAGFQWVVEFTQNAGVRVTGTVCFQVIAVRR